MSGECRERYEQYVLLTREALRIARESLVRSETAEDFLRMAEAYTADAAYFAEQGDYARALAAISYAHAWLDALARMGAIRTTNSRLFTIDDA